MIGYLLRYQERKALLPSDRVCFEGHSNPGEESLLVVVTAPMGLLLTLGLMRLRFAAGDCCRELGDSPALAVFSQPPQLALIKVFHSHSVSQEMPRGEGP